MYHNEHVLNWDKISCRKIPLNIGSLFQNLTCTGNLSTLLQLLILNKAYYLEIKIGLITRNLTKFSRSCSHFGIIFEQEEGKRGIPLYQTWHIVNSITLYHFTSHSISELHIYSIYSIYSVANLGILSQDLGIFLGHWDCFGIFILRIRPWDFSWDFSEFRENNFKYKFLNSY